MTPGRKAGVMRSNWEALKRSFVCSVGTFGAKSQFEEIKKHGKPLRRFDDADALLAYLNTIGGDLDEKDAIYAALVQVIQARGDGSQLATALIWLGLWPGLDHIYRRRQRYFFGEPEALVSEIGARFTAVVQHADLSRIRRPAATLVRNVDRDIGKELKRRWADEARRAELPQERDDDPNDEEATGDRREVLVDPLLRTRGISALGQPPRLNPEDDVEALRGLLGRMVGDDTDLVLGAAVYGFTLRELGERLGLSHGAARLRYWRAAARIRKRLEKKITIR
jgi:RNA polymerase sigma-70 factor (ECF subfamily)